MQNIIIYGGKGNGTVVYSTIVDINKSEKKYNVIGFVNDKYNEKKEIDGVPVLGDIDVLKKKLIENNAYFINAVTALNTFDIVLNIFEKKYPFLKERMISIIHPSAKIGYNFKCGNGVYIGPQCYIGQNVIIEACTFIHAQCYIARDSYINKYSYLAPKVYVGAEVIINETAYLGTGAIIKERKIIGKKALVGMGAIIVDNVPSYSKFFGKKATQK